MTIRQIHKGFVSYRFSLILTLLVFIALRLSGSSRESMISLWGSTLIQIAIALFLLYLTQTFSIIRHKTLLPAFFYLLLTGTNTQFFQDLTGSVSAMVIVLCMLFLFSSYQNPLSQGNAFIISLLLTLCSFYWFPIFVFFPLFWYGLYHFRSLNFKTFLASLMGFVMVYLFIFTWSVHKNDLTLFTSCLPDFRQLWNIHLFSFGIKVWIMNGFLALLLILSGVKIFMASVSEKIQSMTTLSFLYVFTIIVYILSLIQNQWQKEWLTILYIPISLLISHYFTLSYKQWTIWLFLLTIFFFLMEYAF
jgi:hypothetical protein